jgi:predicted nucleic-acid-binding protein
LQGPALKAIGTNVLLRLFVNDDKAQAAKARALFEAHAEEDDSLWIADMVLAELVWALSRSYGRPRSDIVTALRALVGNATVKLESAACLAEATALYELGPADFVDCLLAVKAKAQRCTALPSFDKKMKGLPGVALL